MSHGPFTLTELGVGQRVQLAPHTDLWMRGMKFGVITKVGLSLVTIKGDNDRVYSFPPSHIGEIIE